MAFTTLSGYFMDPIGRLVSLQLEIQEANISMKRMAEILDYEQEQSVNVTTDSKVPSIMLATAGQMDMDKMYQEMEQVDGDIELFSKSIYDNIRVSRMTATLEEVKESAKAADAHEFIKKLPIQYFRNNYLLCNWSWNW